MISPSKVLLSPLLNTNWLDPCTAPKSDPKRVIFIPEGPESGDIDEIFGLREVIGEGDGVGSAGLLRQPAKIKIKEKQRMINNRKFLVFKIIPPFFLLIEPYKIW